MMSRKLILAFSIAFALSVNGVLYRLAPNIYLLQANARVRAVVEPFRIDLRPDLADRQLAPEEPDLNTLASRPGSVRDLLKRVEDEIVPPAELPDVSSDLPDPAERLAEKDIRRDHDLEEDRAAFDQLDAKILEISQKAARENIEVARRLVRPSPNRVVQKGEFPTFRGASDASADAVGFSARQDLFSAMDDRAARGGPSGGRPEFELGVLRPEEEPGLPTLSVENVLGEEAVSVAIRADSRFQPIDDMVAISLDSYIEPRTNQGFFRLQIVPREDKLIDVLPKEVTFLIDASKSIVQRKLDLTVRGIVRCVQMLQPEDSFNIILFRDTPVAFRDGPIPATPANKAEAELFLQDIRSNGSTDIYAAVRGVVQKGWTPGTSRIVIVASDGRPTTGALAGRDLINALTAENSLRTAIYTFGGGRTVNRYLLDLLAYRNKGISRIVPHIDDIDRELPRFFRGINEPILVALKADYGRIDEESIYPKELPDFYRGRAVTVYGKFDPRTDEHVVMRLHGSSGDIEKEVVVKSDLTRRATGDASIARDWAFEKSYYLIGEICRVGERPELVSEIQNLSRQYGIQTSYAE